VGAATELGHGVEIVLLSGGEAIKAHGEKTAIQRITGWIAGFVHIGQGDPGALGCGPGVFSPLLQEVGMALREGHDFGEGNANFKELFPSNRSIDCFRLAVLRRDAAGLLPRVADQLERHQQPGHGAGFEVPGSEHVAREGFHVGVLLQEAGAAQEVEVHVAFFVAFAIVEGDQGVVFEQLGEQLEVVGHQAAVEMEHVELGVLGCEGLKHLGAGALNHLGTTAWRQR